MTSQNFDPYKIDIKIVQTTIKKSVDNVLDMKSKTTVLERMR